jgi:hypothetical protein
MNILHKTQSFLQYVNIIFRHLITRMCLYKALRDCSIFTTSSNKMSYVINTCDIIINQEHVCVCGSTYIHNQPPTDVNHFMIIQTALTWKEREITSRHSALTSLRKTMEQLFTTHVQLTSFIGVNRSLEQGMDQRG